MLRWQMSQSPIHSDCDDATHDMSLRGEALRTEGYEDLSVAPCVHTGPDSGTVDFHFRVTVRHLTNHCLNS